jgi:DNA-binding PadR family transcriptional regulator
VLLGLLSEPASGYDLKRIFGQSVQHFWAAELSQIYPALARLEQDGLLESERVASEKGPNRRIYKRTAAGRKALREWIADGPVCRTERISYLTQVFFLENVDHEKRIQFFQDLRADFADRLATLEGIEEAWRANDPRYPDKLPDKELFKQMTLRSGLLKYRMTVDWCDECLARLAAN